MCGTRRKACRVTLVDRKSRLLLRREAESKTADDCVDRTIIDLLKDLPHKNITPDRGCEFSNCEQINTGLGGIEFYYPEPHQPWQRGTNENANGLLREYFSRGRTSRISPTKLSKCMSAASTRDLVNVLAGNLLMRFSTRLRCSWLEYSHRRVIYL
ncbi:IS30 family transposase [Pyramidobacter sp. C12-8]|uniref:IS30 family transposase n=1 Tax=Pyramidobacter sp. C12-8 TaxID=1943580 RepID=UPI00143C40E6